MIKWTWKDEIKFQVDRVRRAVQPCAGCGKRFRRKKVARFGGGKPGASRYCSHKCTPNIEVWR